jgi:NTE family protein
VSGGAKLVLNNGNSNPVLIGDFEFKRARSFTDRFTFLYSINSRLIFGNTESYFHKSFLGGVQQTDYMENNIPFNGLRRMEICTGSVGAARAEGRMRMWEKIYISAAIDFGLYSEDKLFLNNQKSLFGFGVNAAYDSVVGPLEFNLSFSNFDKDVIPFLSLGYWF